MQLSLAMHSSPRFSTWLWFNDWKVLIDTGDGVSQHLGYKLRKIDTVLLTHAHRDHIGGIFQVINQRGEAGPFAIAHPAHGKSWNQIERFSLGFNPGSSHQAIWRPLEEGDWIETGVEGRLVQCFRTRHFSNDDPNNAPRSLGYHLVWRKNKVKPEYLELSQKELDAVRLEIGERAIADPQYDDLGAKDRNSTKMRLGAQGITAPIDEKIVTVSGDGQPLSVEEVAGAQLLVHEATFLRADDYDADEAGEDVGHVHSTIYDALKLAKDANVPNVVLYHISTRYMDGEIRDATREIAAQLELKARVWPILPRRVYWDVLRDKPIWDGGSS